MALRSENFLGDRYRIFGQREGGMGVVFFCKDLENANRTVALKTYKDSENSVVNRNSFIRESQAWLTMRDAEYIASLEGIETIGGKPYLLMKYYSNGNLRDRLNRSALTVGETVKLGSEILAALRQIHLEKFVHLDLKPENILIGDEGEARVTDLGLVRATANNMAGVSRVNSHAAGAGTLPYMAPEQLLGSSTVGVQADQWAFGVIIYELVMHHRPFSNDLDQRLAREIIVGKPENWSTFRKRVPSSLLSVIEKCLHKESVQRFKDTEALCGAWDSCIKTGFGDVKLGFFKKEERFPIHGKLAKYWSSEIRRHVQGVEVVFKYTEGRNLSMAQNLAKLGKKPEALTLLTDLLGNCTQPKARVLDVWIVDPVFWERQWWSTNEEGKILLKLGRSELITAINLSLTLVIDLWPNDGVVAEEYSNYFTLAKMIAERGGLDGRALCLAGQIIQASGDMNGALLAYNKSLSEGNEKTWPHTSMFLIAALHANNDVDSLRKFAVEFAFPRLSRMSMGLAQCACGLVAASIGEYSLALNYNLAAFELDPSDIRSLVNACRAALSLGDFKKARELRELASQLAPSSPFTHRLEQVFAQNKLG